jgi:hypothetical protein
VTRLTLRASGSVPAATAWDRYAVPARWPTWAPQITRVETAEARLRPGASGRVYGPLGISVRFTVTAVDESARTWQWRVNRGPVALVLDHAVIETRTGSTTTLRVDGPLPLVLAYLPLAQVALHRLVNAH